KPSGWSLTSAAIEKPSFAESGRDDRIAPITAIAVTGSNPREPTFVNFSASGRPPHRLTGTRQRGRSRALAFKVASAGRRAKREVLLAGGGHEAPGIHCFSCEHDHRVAVCGARSDCIKDISHRDP